jgi:ABC-type transport system substrate-binding protein
VKNKLAWLYFMVSMLVMLTLFAACGPTQQPAASEGQAEPQVEEEAEAPAEAQAEEEAEAPAEAQAEVGQNIFIYAHPTTIPDLNPASSFSNDSVIMSNCYETLTFYNPPGSSELLSPKLATSWETNEENTVWTFTLREGVTFHDGEPFNAEAVKAAIENTIELGTGASYIWAPVESIEVVDDLIPPFNLT